MVRGKKAILAEDQQEEEDLIEKTIDSFGKWQLRMTFLLSLCNITCTWHIFSPTFLSKEKDVWCARTDRFKNYDPMIWKNLTQPDGYCSIIDIDALKINDLEELSYIKNYTLKTCTDWEFSDEGETVISEFFLVCNRKYLNNLAEVTFLAGVALGGLICGVLSDKYGRKRMLMASIFIQTLLGVTIAVIPGFTMYMILRTFLGFISVSVVFSGFVLCIELVGGMWRTISGTSFFFPVSFGYISISGIAYLLNDWRNLQLAISLPGIFLLSYWWILPESPRWLITMEKHQEAILVLQQAATANGRTLPDNIDKQILPLPNSHTEAGGIMELFKTKRITTITILLSIIWFVLYFVYYGLVLNIGNIGGNLYVNSVILGVLEVPGIALSIYILLKMGRRWPLALTFCISGTACLITVPIQFFMTDCDVIVTTFAMIGKFTISASNAIVPVFTAELYPTALRNVGVGASNVSAGVSLLLIPYLWELAALKVWIPMSLLGVLGILGGFCTLFLPETGNAPLKDVLEESSNSSDEDGARDSQDISEL